MTGRDEHLPGEPESGELGTGDELEPALLPLLDAEAGPALPLGERERQLMVDRIERQFAQRGRVLPWRAPRRVVLAGVFFAASAAAAVYGVSVWTSAPEPSAPAGRGPGPGQALPSEPSSAEAPPPPLPAPSEPALSEPALSEPALVDPAPAEPVEPAPAESQPSIDPTTADERPAGAHRATPSFPSGAVKAAPSRATGADRLAAASALRARHRYREALALYLQVIESDPDGVQASVARVAAAEVRLDHLGDIAGAERLYREAKTQGGELTAEAQFGLAQVARARGDATGERQALQDFLSRHPGSPLVSAARRRLSALGAR